MDKESIIRKLKENKKYVALIIIVSIITTIILVPTMIIINKQRTIDALYNKAKNGILIEDVYLTHAERELCDENNPEYGYCWVPVDGFTFKIYAKAGDWYHFHYIVNGFNLVWFEYTGKWYGVGSSFWGQENQETWKFDDSSIYTISVYNYDDTDNGTITFFFIVYTNEYYPPDCPLC
ncbi:hypothetical protein ES705_22052 [subsurface metagenome]